MYFLQMPPYSVKAERLNKSDFSVIDELALNAGFREEGRSSLAGVAYGKAIPSMKVMVRMTESHRGSLATIVLSYVCTTRDRHE